MEKKLYVVSTGQYSDWNIAGIFDSKELAEKFISSFYECFNDIQEYTLNPCEKELQESQKLYCVQIEKSGDIKEITQNVSTFSLQHPIWFPYDANFLEVNCFADDEQHAIKIANEKRIQVLALERWNVRYPLSN